MSSRFLDFVKPLLLSVIVAFTFSFAMAQDQLNGTSQSLAASSPQNTSPASSAGAAKGDEVLQDSRTQIYGGWAVLFPGASVGTNIRDIPWGYVTNSTTFLNKKFGLQVESGGHFGGNANIATVQGGPVVRMPLNMVTPFLHADVGIMRMTPTGYNGRVGVSTTVGGGFDIHLYKALDLRLIQADYLYSHISFYPAGPRINAESARISTGLVLNLGSVGPPPKPPAFACSASPTEVYAGEPIQLTGTAENFDPKRKLTYTWNPTGGKVNGDGANVSLDTTGLNAGSYMVNGHVSDGKKAIVDCSAQFTVKQVPPPTVSCSANPTTIQPGGTSTISCQGSSTANRPLTYSYSASAGQVSGQGGSATLSAAGAQPGPITVTGTVTDDKGQSASADTTVTLEAPPQPPPPPPPPTASKVNEIEFHKGKKRGSETRVDNTAKAILDDVALRLQREADAKLVVVGESDPSERNGQTEAAQRAVNTKDYLTKEKGIDPSRIEVRTGPTDGMKAEMWIVPAGATFDQPGTQTVDEAKVKAIPRNPVVRRRRAAPKKPATP